MFQTLHPCTAAWAGGSPYVGCFPQQSGVCGLGHAVLREFWAGLSGLAPTAGACREGAGVEASQAAELGAPLPSRRSSTSQLLDLPHQGRSECYRRTAPSKACVSKSEENTAHSMIP